MIETVEALLAKAHKANASAQLLLASEDYDGACDRAYYSIFHAARAALICKQAQGFDSKTHAGIIAAFGLHFVQTGLLPPEFGRLFNHVEHLRLIADYRERSLDLVEVRSAVEKAAGFIEAVEGSLRAS